MSQSPPLFPAGWYPDTAMPGYLRWWDGAQWTNHTSPMGASTTPARIPSAPAVPVFATGASNQKRNPHSRSMAIASLVVAMAGGLLATVALVTGPLAIAFGCISISQARAHGERKTMATWGIVIGGLTILYAVKLILE